MSALEYIIATGEFPAVKRALLDLDGYDEISRIGVYDALEELADKLEKSIEWGRVEQRRKWKAEEELAKIQRGEL